VLAKKELVKGLPVIQETDEACEECIVGKQHRDSIPKIANWRADDKLQLVHSDICGPINPTSNGGSRYFITKTITLIHLFKMNCEDSPEVKNKYLWCYRL
jgi:hypothetical protein